jgi:hypothetical protein
MVSPFVLDLVGANLCGRPSRVNRGFSRKDLSASSERDSREPGSFADVVR